MKFILIISCLFLSDALHAQDVWSTTVKVESANTAKQANNTALQQTAVVVIAVSAVAFTISKSKAAHYKKINKKGWGSVKTLNKMWNANKRCALSGVAFTAGFTLWLFQEGPVPVIAILKPHLLWLFS